MIARHCKRAKGKLTRVKLIADRWQLGSAECIFATSP
jgi:hypothetical protein